MLQLLKKFAMNLAFYCDPVDNSENPRILLWSCCWELSQVNIHGSGDSVIHAALSQFPTDWAPCLFIRSLCRLFVSYFFQLPRDSPRLTKLYQWWTWNLKTLLRFRLSGAVCIESQSLVPSGLRVGWWKAKAFRGWVKTARYFFVMLSIWFVSDTVAFNKRAKHLVDMIDHDSGVWEQIRPHSACRHLCCHSKILGHCQLHGASACWFEQHQHVVPRSATRAYCLSSSCDGSLHISVCLAVIRFCSSAQLGIHKQELSSQCLQKYCDARQAGLTGRTSAFWESS